MNNIYLYPRVGVAVLLMNENNQVLLGKRKNAHGSNTWAPPGGHLEFGETIEQCAARELMEETGLKVNQFEVGPYTNDVFTQEQKHYITLYLIAHTTNAKPELKEPDKCESWEWFDWNTLPEPLFLPLKNLILQFS